MTGSPKAVAASNKIFTMDEYHYRRYIVAFVKQFVTKDKEKKQIQGIDYSKLMLYLDDSDVTKNEHSYEALCILSNLDKHIVLKLRENNKILPLLLAHAGVFENCVTRRRLFTHYNLPSDGKYSFWSRCIPDNGIRRFLCESYIPLFEKKVRSLKQNTKKKVESGQQPPCCTLCPCEGKGLDSLLNEKEGYFSPDWQMSSDYPPDADMERLTEKMVIIVDTLRNISVDKENAAVLAKSSTFLRFLLLSLHSTLSYLKSNALEILCNVSPYMSVSEPEKHPLILNFILFVAKGIHKQNDFLQMKCFMSLGGWYSIKENSSSKRASQKNYSSLTKFEAMNLQPVSLALRKYISRKDIISVSLIVDLLSNISLHGRRGCDDICRSDDIIKSLVALCTHDLIYDWPTWQRFSSLEKYTPQRNTEDLSSSGGEKPGASALLSVPNTITQVTYVSTNYTIVEGVSAGSRPQIIDVIPEIENKLGSIPQGFGRFPKEKFSEADAQDLGVTFENFEEKLRLTTCNLLKDIATCSATGRRMILRYETRLIIQAMRGTIHHKYIIDILTALASKYETVNKK